jgi:hypothetical protein
MEAADRPLITAASLRARDEWSRGFPGAEVVWEEEADEGIGIGFDGIDPSAMMRAFCRTKSTWPEVLEWYQTVLGSLGWVGAAVRSDWWWEWTAPELPGERFLVMDRSRVPEFLQAWAVPQDTMLYEVLFRVRTSADDDAVSHA